MGKLKVKFMVAAYDGKRLPRRVPVFHSLPDAIKYLYDEWERISSLQKQLGSYLYLFREVAPRESKLMCSIFFNGEHPSGYSRMTIGAMHVYYLYPKEVEGSLIQALVAEGQRRMEYLVLDIG